MAEQDQIILIYSTFPTLDVAESIGTKIVDKRLAACVNIFPKMISVYEWEGKTERSQEVVMIIKTRKELQTKTMEVVKRSHPYDTPALMVIETHQGDSDFFEWIRNQTQSQSGNI